MKTNNSAAFRWASVAAVSLVVAVLPVASHAQGATCSTYPGDKIVYQGSTTTSTHDYIDASQLVLSTAPTDVCYAIHQGLTNLANGNTNNQTSCATPNYATSGVIDARGVASTNGTFASCTTNPFPDSFYTDYHGTNQTLNVTVLLPAGIIPITAPWFLPSNARLIGEGSYNPATLAGGTGAATKNVTELQASGLSSGSVMIYMGDAASPTVQLCAMHNCHGISIEHLGLDGGTVTGLIGIYNTSAQELNYVNDVSLTNMNGTGTGLMLVGTPTSYGANNSGPYTNIYFSGSGTCVDIIGTNNTRGVNGLDCNGTSATPAILVDGRNNLIQNVSISGYTGEGVRIGSQSSNSVPQDNILLNVTGSSSVTTVVRIYSTSAPTDITLMGIGGSTSATLIKDDVTSATISDSSKGFVGLYVLGESIANGHSRFTTNSGVPAWFQGPDPTDVTATCSNGSLYSANGSDADSTITQTLWGCISSSWVALSTN